MTNGTVSATEVDKFDRLAARWWDPNGPMKPLHRMNPARVAWIESLHVLVTSRRVLGLDGEREFAIEPLALPPRGMG